MRVSTTTICPWYHFENITDIDTHAYTESKILYRLIEQYYGQLQPT